MAIILQGAYLHRSPITIVSPQEKKTSK